MSKRKKYTGLSAAEVEASRAKYGINVITPVRKQSWIKAFLLKFTDPMIVILLVAGLLSIGVSYYEYQTDPTPDFNVYFEPIGIFLAILIATTLSFFFEYKASREFNVLNKINDEEPVTVIRSGNTTSVPRSQIVVGDIVILSTGDEIPADGQLLEAKTLGVDESTLTGEPMAHKTTCPEQFDPDATYPSDHVLRGTKVIEGSGIIKVTAVGDSTECGKVTIESGLESGERSPLDEQMARLGKVISYFAYSIAVLVVIGRIILFVMHTPDFEWIRFVNYLLHTAMLAVALLVMAVPEGLPMSVTLSLAYSMRRLLKSNNLVRKLNACETMGAVTVICTDKTGTLTQNRMQVQGALFAVGPAEEYTEAENTAASTENSDISSDSLVPVCTPSLAEAIAINSTADLDYSNADSPAPIGNPTEASLLLWMAASGYDYRDIRAAATVVDTLPFSTERKFMATVAHSPLTGQRMLYVKGAPEIVMALCSKIAPGLTRESIGQQLSEYQHHAMRTLAFASMTLAPDATSPFANDKLSASGLCLDGIVGISDPVRPDVHDAISRCKQAGINVKIVTGDNPATAVEIARRIGLWTDDDNESNIITGAEIAEMSDDELASRAPGLKIIARARPLDKKRLVEALRSLGNVVAVTGDGTNDAPALKSADIGLSMGAGTSVAKQASDITILDNSFVSITSAVMWGRSLYRNIRRFVIFQLTVNVVACLVVVIGSFFGTDSPLTVTQMLWVNLIMDTFAAVALSTLPPSPRVMDEKPRRRNDPMLSRRMWQFILFNGMWMAFWLLLLLFLYMNNREHYLTAWEQTVFFTTFVMMQFWNMFNTKAFCSHRGPFDLKNCTEFSLIALLIFFGQVLIVDFGSSFFSVCPISLTAWAFIIAATYIIMIIPAQIYRHLYLSRLDADNKTAQH